MKTFLAATGVLLAMSLAPAQAQDRYRRDEPPAATATPQDQQADQQAQTPDRRHRGEIQTLRRNGMSSPNVQGEAVPENPNTGVPEAQQRGQSKRESEGSVPRP
jgi:hypothetical protein